MSRKPIPPVFSLQRPGAWRTALALFPTLCALAAAAPAQADPAPATPAAGAKASWSWPEISLNYGQEQDGDYRNLGLSARFAPFWQRDMKGWQASISPEVEYNHFRYHGDADGRRNNNELGVLALFRAEHAGNGKIRPYGEIGLGGAWFSRDTLGAKDLGSHFQFSERIGFGAKFARNWSAGYRFTHYSNGGIESPDNGLNLHQLLVGVAF